MYLLSRRTSCRRDLFICCVILNAYISFICSGCISSRIGGWLWNSITGAGRKQQPSRVWTSYIWLPQSWTKFHSFCVSQWSTSLKTSATLPCRWNKQCWKHSRRQNTSVFCAGDMCDRPYYGHTCKLLPKSKMPFFHHILGQRIRNTNWFDVNSGNNPRT